MNRFKAQSFYDCMANRRRSPFRWHRPNRVQFRFKRKRSTNFLIWIKTSDEFERSSSNTKAPVERIRCIGRNFKSAKAVESTSKRSSRLASSVVRHSFRFDSAIRVDDPQRKLVLYPIPERKEDYVERQLRQLRETLRTESAKRRRPPPSVLSSEDFLHASLFSLFARRAYQPYVYNDLEPYYDTTTVEKAIYEVKPTDPSFHLSFSISHWIRPPVITRVWPPSVLSSLGKLMEWITALVTNWWSRMAFAVEVQNVRKSSFQRFLFRKRLSSAPNRPKREWWFFPRLRFPLVVKWPISIRHD